MAKLFYRNGRLLILTILLIIVWGLSAYLTLPRLEDPELVSRNAVVKAFFPGAIAERVEALVTEPIEAELAKIEEIETYESTSRSGSSIIAIELLEGLGANEVETAWAKIRDKIDEAAAQLPPGATTPELEEIEVKAYALITALTWEQNDPPNWAILRRLTKTLADTLEALPGTEKTESFGVPKEEIVVEIESADVATLGLTAQALSQQIEQSDAKEAAGQLRGVETDLLIEVKGELDSLERVRQIPIRFGNQGQFVRLGEIAQVSKGTEEPFSELALVSGRPAIALGVFVESERRLDRWSQAAQKTLTEFREQLPSGLELRVLFDQNRYVQTRLNKLLFNLLFGAVLVFGVTLLMMGWQSAVIVGIALPLTLLMVLGCMSLLGIPLHQMSVTGLIVALGILIDTAIVMVDEVFNRLQQGLLPEAAIATSVNYLAIPLLSSTITTVLAFMPIALLPGSVGEFVGTIGLNVILAVSASLVLTLTAIPALAVKLFSKAGDSTFRLSWWQTGMTSPLLARLYRRTVRAMTDKPILGVTLALTLPALGFLQASSLDQQFFPAADRNQLQIELELPASAPLVKTQSIVEGLRDQLLQNQEVTDVHWFVGENAPRFYYNLTGGRENEANFAQALVQLQSLSTDAFTRQLQAQVDAAVPTARAMVRQLEQGPPFEAPIELRIYGADLGTLQDLGEKARSLLVGVADVTHTRSSLDESLPQLGFEVDEEKARLVGLDRRSIAQQLDTSLEGIQGGSVLESTEALPVRVRVSNAARGSLTQIASLNLLPISEDRSQGSLNLIPLSVLGDVELIPKPAKIARRNGERVNTIQGFVRAGVLPAAVLSRYQQQLDKLQLPFGYSLEFGGEAEERSSAVSNLVSKVGVLIVLMVATLVLSLGSFRLAGLIAVVAIASFGLGLLSVQVFGYPFGFNPIIGTVGLIGVAINDSIVVLTALQAHPGARLGQRQAVDKVVIHATRHVLTTTLTTMVGFVPLLVDGGEFWPPLAVAIAGGVAGATLLALYFIPSAYLLLTRRSADM